LKWKQMSSEQRKRQVKSAHDSVRGRKKTHSFLMKRAKGVQAKYTLSGLENKFFEAFKNARIVVIPQYAVDVFNVDFAIPERKIAIEIDGGNWHNCASKVIQDKRKEKCLIANGWRLFRFSKNVEHAVALIKKACGNPASLS